MPRRNDLSSVLVIGSPRCPRFRLRPQRSGRGALPARRSDERIHLADLNRSRFAAAAFRLLKRLLVRGLVAVAGGDDPVGVDGGAGADAVVGIGVVDTHGDHGLGFVDALREQEIEVVVAAEK